MKAIRSTSSVSSAMNAFDRNEKEKLSGEGAKQTKITVVYNTGKCVPCKEGAMFALGKQVTPDGREITMGKCGRCQAVSLMAENIPEDEYKKRFRI